jgi:membrane protease YdiL (CAAX protease family)
MKWTTTRRELSSFYLEKIWSKPTVSAKAENELGISLILLVLGASGYFAGIGYLIELSGNPVTSLLGITIGAGLNIALLAVMIFLGIRLGHKIGLGAPLINAELNKEPVGEKFKEILKIAPLLGVISGVLIFTIDLFVFSPLLVPATPPIVPSLASRILVIFYGGIFEELFLRLFILTAVTWFLWRIKKKEDGTPYTWTFWIGIVLSALLFGLLHISATALAVELTTIVIVRAIVLNGIPGVIFGWLYWKQGIESAIVSHIFADLTIHVILQQVLLALLV